MLGGESSEVYSGAEGMGTDILCGPSFQGLFAWEQPREQQGSIINCLRLPKSPVNLPPLWPRPAWPPDRPGRNHRRRRKTAGRPPGSPGSTPSARRRWAGPPATARTARRCWSSGRPAMKVRERLAMIRAPSGALITTTGTQAYQYSPRPQPPSAR